MTLHIENYKHNEELTLADFLYLFLTKLNPYRTTLYDSGEQQCSNNRERSLGDITSICQTYYPNVTQDEVKEVLLNFGGDLVGHFCGTISKKSLPT